MNILVVCPCNLFTTLNGFSIRVKAMIRNIVKAGHRVTLFMFDAPLPKRKKIGYWEGVKIYLFPVKLEILLLAKLFQLMFKISIYELLFSVFSPVRHFKTRLQQIIEGEKIDVIQCEDIFSFSSVQRSVKNIPIVVTLLDVIFERWLEMAELSRLPSFLTKFLINRIKGIELKAINNSAHCLCCSAADLNRFLEIGISAEKLTLASNGVDTENFFSLANDFDFRRKLGIQADDPVLLFSGSDMFQNKKVAQDIIKIILPEALKTFPNLKMLFVGTICEYVKKNRLPYPKNVITVGYVEDLQPYYAITDICLFPFTHHRGAKLKLAEALAAGKAAIATSIGALGYSVTNGEEIIIEDKIENFPQRINELLINKELREKLGKRARKRSFQYDWKLWMMKYNEVYRTVIGC